MDPLPLNRVLCGDCAELLQGFPSDSVDLVVTDPPYGLSFMGKDWDKSLPPRAAFIEVLRVLKPGALCFVMSSPRQDLMWRMMRLLEEAGFEMSQSFISWVYKTGFPKAYDVSKGIDQKLGLKQKVVGVKSDPRYQYSYKHSTKGEEAGHKYGKFNEVDGLKIGAITEPASDEAKRWEGWKSITGLKPALEPILMVNKPMSEATIVDNVLRWGTGAMNADACRIPLQNELQPKGSGNRNTCNEGYVYNKGWKGNDGNITPELGRFPANLVVSDGALDTGEITESGKIEPHHHITPFNNKVYGEYGALPAENHPTYGDSGDQSRYFDLDAWAQHHGILDVPKPDSAERDYGLTKLPIKSGGSLSGSNDGSLNKRTNFKPPKTRNIHPTVKPIKLMAYLIELGCPRGGIVMDPFAGSGTTCIAAKQLKRRYIGIEISPEYHALSEARIAAYPQPLEWFGIHFTNEVKG